MPASRCPASGPHYRMNLPSSLLISLEINEEITQSKWQANLIKQTKEPKTDVLVFMDREEHGA